MRKTYELIDASIDMASEDITNFLKESKLTEKDILKYRLSVEECLLKIKDSGLYEQFTLTCIDSVFDRCITISVKGDEFKAPEDNQEETFLYGNLISSLSKAPKYSYKNGINKISFPRSKKRPSPLRPLAISVVASVLFSVLLKLAFSSAQLAFLLENIINPFYSAAFRLLGYISGPLIMLSVVWGIYGIGDVAVLGHVGKKTILRFLLTVVAIAAAFIWIFPIMGLEFASTESSTSTVGTIIGMVLDIIPKDIFSPFITGNTLQIIFSAVVFGIAMIFLESRISTLAEVVGQINHIVSFVMEFISSLIPYFIALVVVRLILNNTLYQVKSMYMLFAIYIFAIIILATVFTLYISIKHRVSPLLIIRKSIPTFLIAITTASSAAAFGQNIKTCTERFGIDESYVSFSIPLGMVMCKTATTAYYVIISLFFAKTTGLAISAGWLFETSFLSAMLAIATPPIPGGGMIAYTVLFNTLGISDTALSIIIAVDILFDFLRTAVNLYNLPLILISGASTMGFLNESILRSDN